MLTLQTQAHEGAVFHRIFIPLQGRVGKLHVMNTDLRFKNVMFDRLASAALLGQNRSLRCDIAQAAIRQCMGTILNFQLVSLHRR